MKFRKTSRLLAVLLALLLMLGSVSAVLADEDVYIPADQYAEMSDAAVQEFYKELVAATSLEEYNAVVQNMTDAQWNAFISKLNDEQKTAISAQVDALIQAQVEADTYPEVLSAVNFSRVAPFMDPVVGTAPAARMMLMADSEEESNSGLEMSKSVTATGTDAYTITLEAWATGEKIITSTETAIPTDIILVLDQSGSMNYCMYAGCSSQNCSGTHGVNTYTETYSINTNNNYEYYYYNNGSYSRAYYCSDCTGWFSEQHYSYTIYEKHEGTQLTPKTSAESEGIQFYTQSYENKSFDIRKDALVDAVEAFVADVYKKAGGTDEDISTTADNVDHKIAIVGFAGGSNGNSYNTEILTVKNDNGSTGVAYGSVSTANYQSALQDVSTTVGQTMVDDAVDAIEASGATEINLGLELANSIFANNAIPSGETRNRVVVVFTDGTPTTRSDYSSTVANAAISQSKTLKGTYGATVYSVGIFGGADGSNPGSLPANNDTGSNRENRFMHLVSSNYLTASSMDDTGSLNSNLSNGKSYYLSASDKSTLMGIFTSIAQDIENGSVGTTLDENAVVRDVLADQFVLPTNADASSIDVYTEDYTGADTFTNKAPYDATVSISDDGKTISVTNFDFADNWVGTETVNGVPTYRGKKLIIEIPIEVREGFLGGNDVLTNADGSGVYENASAEEALDEFVSPTVDVAIGEVTVTAPDYNVYLLGGVDAADIKADLTVMVDNVKLDMEAENYGLDSWQYAYVTISEGDEAVSDFTGLTADATYNVSCTVTPQYTGTVTEKSGSDTGNINVFKPELTFSDYMVDYQSAIDANGYIYTDGDEDTSDSYTYAAQNYKGVQWKHGNTLSTDTAVTMTGTAPDLTLTYAPTAGVTDGKVTATTYVPVRVTVAIGDTTVTTNTTFVHNDCDVVDSCAWDDDTMSGGDPAFLLHVENIYGSLTITKTVRKSDYTEETFNFAITKPDGTIQTVEITVPVDSKTGTMTLSQMPIGSYTVTETGATDYNTTMNGMDGKTVTVTVEANTDTKVNVVNTATGTYDEVTVVKYWSDGDNAWQTRTGSVTVYLNGTDAKTLSASNNWTDKWTNVPMYDADGNRITYAVKEDAVDFYDTTYGGDVENGFTVTNTLPVGNLTITKSGLNAGDSAILNVTIKRGDTTARTYQVVLTANNDLSKTIAGIPAGYTYEVAEDANWITRYEYSTTSNGMSGTIVKDATQTAAVVNTANPGKWLDDESAAENIFNGAGN